METDLLVAGGFIFLLGSWILQSWLYSRIHDVWPKWWAIPFANGALFWMRRLPAKWERTRYLYGCSMHFDNIKYTSRAPKCWCGYRMSRR